MMLGHEDLVKNFNKLAREGNLSHSYIFFGEPQVGKFTFAKSLANFLENGKFELPQSYLRETFETVASENDSIGIDSIRDLKYFLSEKPVSSKKRVVIVDEAENLTSQAQNAILKIAEEPPQSSLIILVVSNPEALLQTVQSRFVKAYFGRISNKSIADFLVKNFKVKMNEANKIADYSFGRPGRAIEILRNEELKQLREEVIDFLKRKSDRVSYLRRLDDSKKINFFLRELIAELSSDVGKNWYALKNIEDCLVKMSKWNTNKRLQLEAALWNI